MKRHFDDGVRTAYEQALAASLDYDGVPIQPVVTDRHGTVRWKENRIVSLFMEKSQAGEKFDLNDLAIHHTSDPFEDWEWFQFHQLIGYSLSGCPSVPRWAEFALDDLSAEAVGGPRPRAGGQS